jgi:RNA polymerase sigma-70 factor, ECF subfamily
VSPFPTTNPKLIASLVEPSTATEWDSFIQLYEPAMQNWFRKKGLVAADAEDCSQRVLLRLVKSLHSYEASEESGCFRKWLYRVAANEFISFIRSEAKHQRSTHDSVILAELATKSDAALSQELNLEMQRRLFFEAARIVESLVSETHWQSFWRTYVLGDSAQSVAAKLGTSVGAIYVAKGRILKLLQQQVNELQGEDR